MGNSLSIVEFSSSDILDIIKNLSQNKAYVYDMMSTRMLKVFDECIFKQLKIISTFQKKENFRLNEKKSLQFLSSKKLENNH